MNKKIKELLMINSFQWIVENQKAWLYFRKSDYFQYLKEDIKKYKNDEFEISDSVFVYGNKFGQNTNHLNLF